MRRILGILLCLLPILGSASTIGTYFGGTDDEKHCRIAVDSAGYVYLCGNTKSHDLDTTENCYQPYLYAWDGVSDVFVAKFDPTLTHLIFCTYIGGPNDEGCCDIKVDNDGYIYVAGRSTGFFPTTPFAMNTSVSGDNGFVFKMNPTGTGLIYSTAIYGHISGMDIDTAGCVYITGLPGSSSFPYSANAKNTTFNNVFVMKLNQEGSGFEYSTFLGGSGYEMPYGIKVDKNGNAYVTGGTGSSDFPVTAGVFGATTSRGIDTYLVKINPTGTDWVFSTYLNITTDDQGCTLDVDTAGNIYVASARRQDASNKYTIEPIDLNSGNIDLVITKINPDATQVLYSFYTGGNSHDYPQDITVSPEGRAYLVGYTFSTNFPVAANSINTTGNGFLIQLSSEGSVESSILLSPNENDYFYSVIRDPMGNIYTAGDAYATNSFVSSGTYKSSYTDLDAVILKMSPSAVPVELSDFQAN